jgi:nucleotidyltransferase substrate binding protein (TIGR01987 family)
MKFDKFKKALQALEAIYDKPMQEDRSNVDATIQRFEFTFELFWKFLKDFFYEKGLEVNYPKDIIRQSYINEIIEDEELWLQMLKDRNLTSHTYDEALADEIFKHIKLYVPLFKEALLRIEVLFKR